MNAVTKPKPDAIALPRYDDMCRAIAECRRVDEVKSIRDKAEALRAYSRMANNREAEVQFAEIKVMAERQAGHLLAEMAASGERTAGRGGDRRSSESNDKLSLDEIGIDAKESERFQKIAAVPQKAVEAAFKEARENQVPVTSAQIRALTKQPNFTPEQKIQHDRLWRVLRAIEQISEQDINPREWLNSLPDYMVTRVDNHFKKARPWLERLFELWDAKNE